MNKVAVITVGDSGIGYATAKKLAAHGAKVVITGRNKDAVNRAAQELGVTGMISDQGNLADIDQLVAGVAAALGKVDILFLNAGLTQFSPVASATEVHYDSVMDLNVKGVFFTVQKFIPFLNDGGSIIFMSSVNAVLGMPDSSVYSASKAALLAINRVLARELAPRKIRVNAVSPGPIDTPLYIKMGYTPEQIEGFKTALGQKILLTRFGTADEVASAVKFLASDESSFITGTEITIDGGLTVNAVV